MNYITKKEFDLKKSEISGVVAFLNNETCSLCEMYAKQLEPFKSVTTNWTVVLLADDDDDWCLKNLITGTPTTRVYYRGLPIHEVGGLLFDLQVNKILLLLDEYCLK